MCASASRIGAWLVVVLGLLCGLVPPAGAAFDSPVIALATAQGRLVAVEDHRVPLVWVRVLFPIGSHSSWAVENSLELLWPAVVHGGMGTRSSSAEVEAWVGPNTCGVDLLFLTSEQEAITREFRGILDSDFSEVRVSEKILRQTSRWVTREPFWLLQAELARLFYDRRDPRRIATQRPGSGTFTSYSLQDIRDRVLRLDGRILGMAGDLDRVQVKQLSEDLLGGWPSRQQAASSRETAIRPLLDPSTRPASTEVLVRGGEEVVLGWARAGLSLADPQAPAALVAEEALSRRLERLLRGERGDTYVVHSQGLLAREPRVYALITSTAPGRALAHSDAMRAALEQVAEQGLDTETIEQARSRILAQAVLRTHAPYEVLAEHMTRLLYKDQPDLLALLERAKTVPAEDVDRFARSFYDPEAMTAVRVVPRGYEVLLETP